jgi:hypothetical protein
MLRDLRERRWRTFRREDRQARLGELPQEGAAGPADSKLDEYREIRAAVGKRLQEAAAAAEEPGIVADVVVQAAAAARPKLRYMAGRVASRPRWLRRFAPAGVIDAGIRKNLRLEALTESMPPALVLEEESHEPAALAFDPDVLMSGLAMVRDVPRALQLKQVDGNASSRRRSGTSIASV